MRHELLGDSQSQKKAPSSSAHLLLRWQRKSVTVLGIETSSLIPNPVFLSYTIPTIIGSSGNLGTRERGNAQTCSFHAMTQVSSVLLIVLSDIPVLATGWREAEKGRLWCRTRNFQHSISSLGSRRLWFSLKSVGLHGDELFPQDSQTDMLLLTSV